MIGVANPMAAYGQAVGEGTGQGTAPGYETTPGVATDTSVSPTPLVSPLGAPTDDPTIANPQTTDQRLSVPGSAPLTDSQIFFTQAGVPGDRNSFANANLTPSGLNGVPGARISGRPGLSLSIDQAARYDDNVRNLSGGQVLLPGRSRGDLYSVTTVGGSFRVIAGLQQFFISGSYGETIYKSSSDLDRTRYSISAGVDWRLTGACSGRFAVQTDQSEQSVDTLVVLTGNNIVNTDAINFSGRCHVFNRLYATFGASARTVAYSQNTLNNLSQNAFNLGLEYSVPKLYTLGFQATYSDNSFDNGALRTAFGLSSAFVQTDYTAYYRYTFSPKTELYLSGGVSTFNGTGGGFGQSGGSAAFPIYAVSLSWRPTRKLGFILSSSYRVSTPQGASTDYQRQYTQSASATYLFSPKLSFIATASMSSTENSTFSPLALTRTALTFDTITVGVDANYRFSRFFAGSLGYRLTERSNSFNQQSSTSNLYTARLNYQY